MGGEVCMMGVCICGISLHCCSSLILGYGAFFTSTLIMHYGQIMTLNVAGITDINLFHIFTPPKKNKKK